MSNKTFGGAVLIIGLALLVVSIVADSLGLGNEPGLGWKQIVGLVVAVAIIVFGILALVRPERDDTDEGRTAEEIEHPDI